MNDLSDLPVSCNTLYQSRQEMLFQLLQKSLCQSLRMQELILHCKFTFSVKHKQIILAVVEAANPLYECGCRTYYKFNKK